MRTATTTTPRDREPLNRGPDIENDEGGRQVAPELVLIGVDK